MTVVLNPKTNNSQINLQTITNNKLRRVNRVRRDLDKTYIEAETQARSKYLNFPYIDLYGFPIDTNHLIKIPEQEAVNLKIGVFLIRNKEMLLATPEPGYSGQSVKIDSLIQAGYTIKVYLCSELSFEKLLNTYQFVIESKQVNDDIVLSKQMFDEAEKQGVDLKSLENKLVKASMSEAIEIILAAAIQNKASDIHFEPEKESYNLRLRLDGVLHTFARLPLHMQKSVESRLKLIAGLKLNVDNVPQDGRFSFKADDRDIDVRISMLPSSYGYSIVMRLLGTDNVILDLKELGFTGLAAQRIMLAVQKSQGMILTTGPTGSGKTTTLYTFLKHLNDGESKIITLEDPIEYKLSGISQTQIDATSGYTFAGGLRSILRQDPDVVMVGEIRDKETADTAVQASLTGHQVLSTIHTNDAAGAIPRLMEMEIKGFLLADSLSAVIGQRLVRRLCPFCKHHDVLTPDQQKFVETQLQTINPSTGITIPQSLQFFTTAGCNKCNGIGYKGRIGLYEVLSITDGLRELISSQFPSIVEVRQVAQKEGMITMLQDGILKALQGVTDIKELIKNVA